jgi:ABC-2 type transport system ATP-binding protein
MIELKNLTKRFGNFTAVDDLSLTVSPGEILGFLGPNGAGKTTTIKMMTGILKPTRGTAVIGGCDIVRQPLEAKRVFGFIPDRPFLYEQLTGAEFLRFVSGLYRLPEARSRERRSQLLDLFDLAAWKDEPLSSYSHGMKQRLVMASALLHEPRVLIVDEPMVGLDPRGARMVKQIFREEAARGVSLFLSTHSLELAADTCDRIAVILKGRLIAQGTREELGRMAGCKDESLESVFLKLTGGWVTGAGDFLHRPNAGASGA